MALITVIGGANCDIRGVSLKPMVKKDSNPGRVTVSAGGVGFNIAQNLALLGHDVEFVTALGDDSGAELIRSCAQKTVSFSDSLTPDGKSTGTYVFIENSNGDMEAAVNDMEILECLTPEYIRGIEHEISESDLLVIDANLNGNTIEAACELAAKNGVPVFADCVSEAKCMRLRKSLKYITLLKPNLQELEKLSGTDVNDTASCARACEVLCKEGVKAVSVTFKSAGANCYTKEDGLYFARAPKVKVKSSTGAGDAFIAGYADAYLNGSSFRDGLVYALAVSALKCLSEKAVNDEITREAVEKTAKGLKAYEQIY